MHSARMLWLASSMLPAVLVGGTLCDSTANENEHTGRTLKSVQVLFRHGARTPLTDMYWRHPDVRFEKGTLCGDLIKDKVNIKLTNHAGGPRPFSRRDAKQAATILPGGCSQGELTLQGQQQALALGTWLRNRYVDDLEFLPPEPLQGTVAGRTTNFRRTIGTLELLVAGLLRKAHGSVDITTAAELDEILFCNAKRCAQLGALMTVQREVIKTDRGNSDEVRQLESRVKQAMKLSNEDDEEIAFVELHDALTTLRFHDQPLPGRFDDQLLVDIEKEATQRMLGMIAPQLPVGGSPVEQDGLLRLGVGLLTAEVLRHLEEAASGDAKHQMYLYSGHDTTIMPVLRALGVDVDRWPGYCSNIIFELWEDSAGSQPKTFVRVLYQQKPLKFPGSDEDGCIDLRDLQRGTFGQHATTAEEYEKACKVPLQEEAGGKQEGDSIQGL